MMSFVNFIDYRRYSAGTSNDLSRSLGDTKISDIKGTMKKLPDAGRGVFNWYAQRYLNSTSRRTGPLIHLALLCGVLGYSFEYPHLSIPSYYRISICLNVWFVEHLKEHSGH